MSDDLNHIAAVDAEIRAGALHLLMLMEHKLPPCTAPCYICHLIAQALQAHLYTYAGRVMSDVG